VLSEQALSPQFHSVQDVNAAAANPEETRSGGRRSGAGRVRLTGCWLIKELGLWLLLRESGQSLPVPPSPQLLHLTLPIIFLVVGTRRQTKGYKKFGFPVSQCSGNQHYRYVVQEPESLTLQMHDQGAVPAFCRQSWCPAVLPAWRWERIDAVVRDPDPCRHNIYVWPERHVLWIIIEAQHKKILKYLVIISACQCQGESV
jgi:hypothetical protein